MQRLWVFHCWLQALERCLPLVCACSVDQLSLTRCNSLDCSPPGSSVHRIVQEYRSGLLFPPPGDFPDPGIERTSLALLHWQTDSFHCCPLGSPIIISVRWQINNQMQHEIKQRDLSNVIKRSINVTLWCSQRASCLQWTFPPLPVCQHFAITRHLFCFLGS